MNPSLQASRVDVAADDVQFAQLSRTERKQLNELASLVTQLLGIRMPAAKHGMLYGRVTRRMRTLGLATLSEYAALLQGPSAQQELVHFCDAVTTNKTEFFREPSHFQYLTGTALPELAAGRRAFHCNVWCAGCSTGQEPYTLAMVLEEYKRRESGFSYALTATDVSTRALAHAVRAIYQEELVQPVPPELRRRYFLRSKDRSAQQVRVVPELRRRVTFARLNFAEERYALNGPFDVIFFRNVLIYFDPPTQEAVIRKQCVHLAEGGYFFTSHTETTSNLDVPLQLLAAGIHTKSG